MFTGRAQPRRIQRSLSCAGCVIENEPANRPDPILMGLSLLLGEHMSPSDGSDWRCLSEGALCAGLANRASDDILRSKCSICILIFRQLIATQRTLRVFFFGHLVDSAAVGCLGVGRPGRVGVRRLYQSRIRWYPSANLSPAYDTFRWGSRRPWTSQRQGR